MQLRLGQIKMTQAASSKGTQEGDTVALTQDRAIAVNSYSETTPQHQVSTAGSKCRCVIGCGPGRSLDAEHALGEEHRSAAGASRQYPGHLRVDSRGHGSARDQGEHSIHSKLPRVHHTRPRAMQGSCTEFC